MKDENEHISLWILEKEREENRIKAQKDVSRATRDEKFHCLKCKKAFGEPKLVQFYACPHCLNKFEEETKKKCQHWFGFLSQKEKSELVPPQCIECERVLECILNKNYSSPHVVSEIKKWY